MRSGRFGALSGIGGAAVVLPQASAHVLHIHDSMTRFNLVVATVLAGVEFVRGSKIAIWRAYCIKSSLNAAPVLDFGASQLRDNAKRHHYCLGRIVRVSWKFPTMRLHLRLIPNAGSQVSSSSESMRL
jgi:hypothetical protein